ncbi:MAG: hypothetical protein ACRD1H_18800 [Vicinamibacterales bacterium]
MLALTLLTGCGERLSGADADATYLAGRTGSQLDAAPAATTRTLTPATPAATAILSSEAPPVVTSTAVAATVPPTPTAPTSTPEPTATPTPVARGDGSLTTEPINLRRGLAVVTIGHRGDGPFSVDVFDAGGPWLATLASTDGGFFGSRGLVVPADGAYTIDVVASGDWWLDIRYPTRDIAVVSDTPYEHRGSGSQAVYFVKVAPGSYRLSATHDADSPFAVALMTDDGSGWQQVIDVTGVYDGTADIAIAGDGEQPVYLLIDILAAGEWTIRIE